MNVIEQAGHTQAKDDLSALRISDMSSSACISPSDGRIPGPGNGPSSLDDSHQHTTTTTMRAPVVSPHPSVIVHASESLPSSSMGRVVVDEQETLPHVDGYSMVCMVECVCMFIVSMYSFVS